MRLQPQRVELGTPETDAAVVKIKIDGEEFFGEPLVRASFARRQELRIQHLELALHQIKHGCVDEDDKVNEWYRSAPQEIRKICVAALKGDPL